MSTASIESLRAFVESQLPAALQILHRMVDINSYTANAAGVNEVGKFTAECFARLGFSAETVPSTNPDWGRHLVMTRPGRSARSIAMISHLDTVFSPEEEARNNFRWQPEGDWIFGPGTQDIKGGSAMMWLVLTALRHWAPDVFESITWKLLWNSSEEVLSKDFAVLCRNRFDAETIAALVFEAEGRLGEDRLLVVARKGRATWRVTASGRASHAGAKHRSGANAITQIGQTVQRIAQLTDYRRELTFNAGIISGGTGVNRVPHEAFVEGEFRAFSPEVYEDAKRQLLSLSGPGEVVSVADRFPCQVKVEILSESCPWPRNGATDKLLEVWQATGKGLGLSVMPQERGGLSDGNFIWDAVPTIDGLGPWGDNDHCSERSADGSKLPEYVDVTSFVPKAVLNAAAIAELVRGKG